MMLSGQLDETKYKKARNDVQRMIYDLYIKTDMSAITKGEAGDILRKCMEADNSFIDEMLKKGVSVSPQKIKGGMFFKHYWSKANKGFNAG